MINGKVIKFGYGDVGVGSCSITQRITFQQFKPPEKPGTKLTNDGYEFVGDKILIIIKDENEYSDVMNLLSQVRNKDISDFEFKGYVFDFSNYNEESIKACKKHIKSAMNMYWFAMAC